MKKFLCIALAIILALGATVSAAATFYDKTQDVSTYWDHECKTECKGKCGTSPIIIVPGIMQSQTYVTDPQGNIIMTSEKTAANNYQGFPVVEGMDMSFMFDTNAIVENLKSRIPDLIKAMIKPGHDELLDIVVEILDEAIKDHYFNDDGTRTNGVKYDEYWYSCAEAMKIQDSSYGFAKGYKTDDDGNTKPTVSYATEYDFIKRQVDMTSYAEKYGYDHVYYYAYPSFGDTFTAAENLNEYIEMVKTQTGHDKVSICFISLGGTLANVFLAQEDFPADSIDRIILAACALDGSYLLSDLMDANTTLDDTSIIYNDLIPNIVALAAKEYMSLAYLGNTIARILPEELFSELLDDALTRGVNECLAKMIRNCPSMWALVPSDVYQELSAKYISDESHKLLKEKTDKYYNIQKNAKKTIQKRDAEGVEIFTICGYNLELPALVGHYRESSDNIIQASSTSAGATFAKQGEKLPSNYVPSKDASYISPDGMVDAGTCALPDRTFFVKNQSHLELQSSTTDVIELCIQIATNKKIQNARDKSDGYPQFNEYRDLSTIKTLVHRYAAADESKRAGATEAYNKAMALVASRTWSQAETLEVEKEFASAMKKAGLYDESNFTTYTFLPFLEKVFKAFSDIYAKIFGGKDFYLIPWFLI